MKDIVKKKLRVEKFARGVDAGGANTLVIFSSSRYSHYFKGWRIRSRKNEHRTVSRQKSDPDLNSRLQLDQGNFIWFKISSFFTVRLPFPKKSTNNFFFHATNISKYRRILSDEN